ncbi:MAG: hypothetical protein QM775_31480 [Pirellulales bacterium]
MKIEADELFDGVVGNHECRHAARDFVRERRDERFAQQHRLHAEAGAEQVLDELVSFGDEQPATGRFVGLFQRSIGREARVVEIGDSD